MILKFRLLLLATVSLLTIGLVGCSNTDNTTKDTTETTETSSTEKSVTDYLAGLSSRGLTADNQQTVDVATLDSQVAATSAISFTGESDTSMMLLQFKTQAEAMTAQTYYTDQDKRTHTDQRLLLISDRTLGKDWFEKYQKGIFQQ
jgi:hypothetical protein